MLIDTSLFAIVHSTIHKEAVNIDTILGLIFTVFRIFCFQNFKAKVQFVNGNLVKTGVCLEDTRQETLREEQSADPIGNGIALGEPVVDELHTQKHIIKPIGKRLE